MDKAGKTRYAYSWKLVPTDPVPKGKRDGKSLKGIRNGDTKGFTGRYRHDRRKNDAVPAIR